MLTVSVRKYSSGFCVPAQLRDAEIVKRWADNRGGQGVLHGAGVQDAHNVAGEGRRKRGEERPVQPVLAVQLDDLRKHPRKSRYASVTSGADGNKTESNQTHFLVAELHKRCSGDH